MRAQTYTPHTRSLTRACAHTHTHIRCEIRSWIGLVIGQAAHMESASVCLTRLLNNNKKLLDENVTRDTLQRFMETIQERGPKPATMGFFRAICSCRGKKILSNQEMCLSELVKDQDNHDKLLLRTIQIQPKMFDFMQKHLDEMRDAISKIDWSKLNADEHDTAEAEETKMDNNDDKFKEFFFDYLRDIEPSYGVIKKEWFDAADTGQDGMLDLDETRKTFALKSAAVTSKALRFVFEAADLDNNNRLDREEFYLIIMQMLHPGWIQDFKNAYYHAKSHPESSLVPYTMEVDKTWPRNFLGVDYFKDLVPSGG